MPVLMSSIIYFSKGYYCIDISALKYRFPQIEADKDLDIFLIEVRDEKDKIVKKFTPFKKPLRIKILEKDEYPRYCIQLPTNISDELGIGQFYKAVFIITKYDNKPFVLGYIKYVGGSEKYQKLFKNIGTKLLTLLYSIDNVTLHEATIYVLNAYRKLKNREIEDSRTWLRKALEKLEEIFNHEIKVSEDIESKKYPNYICTLIKALKNFVNYGGPHEGPAPEHTTKFILYVTEKLIEHLSYSIYKGVISIDSNKPSNSNPCKEIKKENQND
jgi:hypothetical protein